VEFAVDIVLAVAAVAAIAVGWHRGALITALSMVGLLVGLWIGLLVAPFIVELAFPHGHGGLIARTVVAAAVVLVCGAVLYGVATGLATSLRKHIGRRKALNGIDASGGALIGLIAWAAVVWLVAGFVQSSSIYPASQLASSSRIVTMLDDIAPVPPAAALGALDEALGSAGLPQVFSGTETIPQTTAPDSAIPAAVQSKAPGVVKVEAIQASCSMESSGSGWVEARGVVVTNAHVVAGASSVHVIGQDDLVYDATVVAFDSQRDVAVLRVPGLPSTVLQQGDAVAAGDPAVVAGYPGGGAYTLGSARVRGELEAAGTDIYQHNAVVRDVYSLRAIVRPGNSGGPLFDDAGDVVGMVFARSTTDADTGYALTLDELRPVLQHVGSARVATGVCTAE
jgi:S1-C subfamily serine protease